MCIFRTWISIYFGLSYWNLSTWNFWNNMYNMVTQHDFLYKLFSGIINFLEDIFIFLLLMLWNKSSVFMALTSYIQWARLTSENNILVYNVYIQFSSCFLGINWNANEKKTIFFLPSFVYIQKVLNKKCV